MHKTKRPNALFRLSALLAEAIEENSICKKVVEELHASLGYDFVALFILDERTQQRNLIASIGFDNPLTPLLPGQGLSEQPFLTGKMHYTPNVRLAEAYTYGMGGSEIDVPIWIKDSVKGALVVESKSVNDFTNADFDILTATAHITGLAIEKSRVIEEERKRSAELQALSSTIMELAAEIELSSLLEKIVERASFLLNGSGGELGLFDHETNEITIVVCKNLKKDHTGCTQKIGEGLMGQIAEKRQPIIIRDYQEWSGGLPHYGDVRSTIGVPLIIHDQLLGVITTITEDKSRIFDDSNLRILNLFAHQASIAIEKAKLIERYQFEIKQRKELMKEVSKQKEYYEALLINNPIAVVSADLNGIIISWNPMAYKLFGYKPEEVIGKPLDDFVANHPDLKQEAQTYTYQAIHEGQVNTTTKRTRKDGSLVDVDLLALPIIVSNERIGFIAIYHDLTELKQIERSLRINNEKMTRELQLAGEIQNSFLPKDLPNIPDWFIDAQIISASETSGDFYDIRILPDGKLLVLIADVIDKGVGAALFMSLCWSLFRLISEQHKNSPSEVFQEVNKRILTDTQSGQFVTVFFGLLDPTSGELIYSNAGHCPPYLMRCANNGELLRLTNTGMPLGIDKNQTWEEEIIHIAAGDSIIFYTDGIIESMNISGDFYGEENLQKILQVATCKKVEDLKDALLADVQDFVGLNAQMDDIGIIVIKNTAQ